MEIKGLSSYFAIPEGWLATADSGEFGGGLYLVPTDRGDTVEISPGNFHCISLSEPTVSSLSRASVT